MPIVFKETYGRRLPALPHHPGTDAAEKCGPLSGYTSGLCVRLIKGEPTASASISRSDTVNTEVRALPHSSLYPHARDVRFGDQ